MPDGRPPAASRAESQRIATAHPDDWRAWLLVGLTAADAPARRAAAARGLALDPNQPVLMTLLAALDIDEGRFDEGLLLATRAMSFRQNLWPAAFQAMRAQAALGHCPEAAALADVMRRRGPASLGPRSQEAWRRSGCH